MLNGMRNDSQNPGEIKYPANCATRLSMETNLQAATAQTTKERLEKSPKETFFKHCLRKINRMLLILRSCRSQCPGQTLWAQTAEQEVLSNLHRDRLHLLCLNGGDSVVALLPFPMEPVHKGRSTYILVVFKCSLSSFRSFSGAQWGDAPSESCSSCRPGHLLLLHHAPFPRPLPRHAHFVAADVGGGGQGRTAERGGDRDSGNWETRRPFHNVCQR